MKRDKFLLGLALGVISLITGFLLSIFLGPVKLPFLTVVKEILSPGNTICADIIWGVRIPRAISASLIGSGLAVSGALFQALFRNPLVGPYTVGVSGGAGLGATVCILTGLYLGVPIGALLGGLGVGYIVYRLGKVFTNVTLGVLLVGVMLSFLCSGIIMLLLAVSKSMQVHQVFLWVMGGIKVVSLKVLGIVFVGMCSGIFAILLFSEHINALLLGEEYALQVGVNVYTLKKWLFLSGISLTAICVSLGGIIGFVGLVIPHFLRLIFGNDYKLLIPVSALLGGSFLCVSDVMARSVIQPYELPVGVITGVVGSIIFVIVFLRINLRER